MAAPDLGSPWPHSCEWCSTATRMVYHGGPCPRVKAIEYHPSGLVKRVEFFRDEEHPEGRLASDIIAEICERFGIEFARACGIKSERRDG